MYYGFQEQIQLELNNIFVIRRNRNFDMELNWREGIELF